MQNLKLLRKQKGISLKELGGVLGVAESTVSLYESGKREPSCEILRKLSNFYGVSVDFLIGNEKSSTDKNSSSFIPIIDTVVIENGKISYLYTDKFETAGVRYAEKYFYLTVHGDMMEPQICDGDLALIEKQSDISSGGIFAVICKNSSVSLKRITVKGSAVFMQPFNPKYPSDIVDDINDLIILGKVVATTRKW